MKKFAIRHKPTNTWYYEDEAVIALTEKPEVFANDRISCECHLDENAEDAGYGAMGMVWTEDGEYPRDEFEVVEFSVNEV